MIPDFRGRAAAGLDKLACCSSIAETGKARGTASDKEQSTSRIDLPAICRCLDGWRANVIYSDRACRSMVIGRDGSTRRNR
jgi:hypothetical protein